MTGRLAVGHFVRHIAGQSLLDTVPIVKMFERIQFLFQVPLAPEQQQYIEAVEQAEKERHQERGRGMECVGPNN
jgi:hypothetical protein